MHDLRLRFFEATDTQAKTLPLDLELSESLFADKFDQVLDLLKIHLASSSGPPQCGLPNLIPVSCSHMLSESIVTREERSRAIFGPINMRESPNRWRLRLSSGTGSPIRLLARVFPFRSFSRRRFFLCRLLFSNILFLL